MLLVPLLLVLGGCASPAADVDFGESADSHTVQCVHLRIGDRVLIGDTVRTGASPVELRSAGLRDAVGVRVVHAWVVENPGGSSFGVTDLPPPDGLGWATRIRAGGAVLPARRVRNIVLEVQRTAEGAAGATGIRLRVGPADAESTVDSAITYRFPTTCS